MAKTVFRPHEIKTIDEKVMFKLPHSFEPEVEEVPEIEEPVKAPEQIEIEEIEPIEEPVEEPVKAPEKEKSVDFLMTEKLDVTFVSDSGDLETIFQLLKQLGSHAGRCRIRIEIEAV